nr:hypothetical protein B0A51_12868 [Rachicladosporium sp. CCFEE 5018]
MVFRNGELPPSIPQPRPGHKSASSLLGDATLAQHQAVIHFKSWLGLQIARKVFDSMATFGAWLHHVTSRYLGNRSLQRKRIGPYGEGSKLLYLERGRGGNAILLLSDNVLSEWDAGTGGNNIHIGRALGLHITSRSWAQKAMVMDTVDDKFTTEAKVYEALLDGALVADTINIAFRNGETIPSICNHISDTGAGHRCCGCGTWDECNELLVNDNLLSACKSCKGDTQFTINIRTWAERKLISLLRQEKVQVHDLEVRRETAQAIIADMPILENAVGVHSVPDRYAPTQMRVVGGPHYLQLSLNAKLPIIQDEHGNLGLYAVGYIAQPSLWLNYAMNI